MEASDSERPCCAPVTAPFHVRYAVMLEVAARFGRRHDNVLRYFLMSVFCSAADTAGEFDDTISQAVVTALAINIVRMDAWLTERPFAKTRRSAFASLRPMRG